jgi:hypothetical protein
MADVTDKENAGRNLFARRRSGRSRFPCVLLGPSRAREADYRQKRQSKFGLARVHFDAWLRTINALIALIDWNL